MSWLDIQTSFYKCQADNLGRPETFRNILLSAFGVPHEWFYRNPDEKLTGVKWVSGFDNDIHTILDLRAMDKADPNYKKEKPLLKGTLQCFTPAALLKTKKKDQVEEISRTGIMQLDFDFKDIKEYDVEELKQCVFQLPYVGFCGLSCGGEGFYALVLIAEPERLGEYAEHCFAVLMAYGIKADTSKGPKPENLRYVSYDSNMLIRENPEVLRIKHFKTIEAPKKTSVQNYSPVQYSGNDALIKSCLNKIKAAQTGQRWQTVQQVSFTLGGLGDPSIIHAIKSEIESNPEFNGEEAKYCKCAEDCFIAGAHKPLLK